MQKRPLYPNSPAGDQVEKFSGVERGVFLLALPGEATDEAWRSWPGSISSRRLKRVGLGCVSEYGGATSGVRVEPGLPERLVASDDSLSVGAVEV